MGKLDKYYAIKEAVGLAIRIGKDGDDAIDACRLVLKGNNLSIEAKETDLNNLDEFKKKIGAAVPVALNLRGRGVLLKQIAKVEEITAANFSLVLPNALLDDFYVQHFISGESSFVSVIRKSDADHWIGMIRDLGLVIVSLSLGPFAVSHVMPQLNLYGEQIEFDGHQVNLDSAQNWMAYRNDPSFTNRFTLKIENEPIDQRLILPYAAVFQLVLADRLEPVVADHARLRLIYGEQQDQRKFNFYGLVILLTFFTVLLANFIILFILNGSNIKMSGVISRNNRSTADQQMISERAKQKEALLHELGWTPGPLKSVMNDQLAGMMPTGIILKNVAFNPLEASGRTFAAAPKFRDGLITVRGLSPQVIPVNEWIARLKTLGWVKEVRLDNYTYNSEQETGVFLITITY